MRSVLPAPIFCPAKVAIVAPSESKGHAKNPPILLAAVMEATAMEPREFTALCRITLPIAVTEYCSPMGIPMLHRIFTYWDSSFHSSFLICKISNFFLIYSRQLTPDTAWETTVATAAPATPICRTMMQKRSRKIFRKAERIRKYRGVLLSPMARRIPETILYRMVAGIPAKIITI